MADPKPEAAAAPPKPAASPAPAAASAAPAAAGGAAERTMRGSYDKSSGSRLLFVVLRHLDVLIQAALLFGGANSLLGMFGFKPVPRTAADVQRFYLLLAMGWMCAARQSYWAVAISREAFPLKLTFANAGYNFVVDLMWTMFAVRQTSAELTWMQFVAIPLCIAGSIIETLADLQRKWWKDNQKNDGKLLTSGLYTLCQNPNYFGYLLWRIAFGLATGSYIAALLSLHNIPDFLTVSIPQKEKYMKEKYGGQYESTGFNKRAKLIPFIL